MLRKPNSECQIMVFYPTMEEFSDFSRYIQYMESQGAHRGGIAKIVPPKEWVACKSYDNIDDLTIPAPISQVVTGQKGLYTQYNIQQKPMSVKELRKMANTDKHGSPFHENYEDLERTYWKNITFNPAIYGADISGSLYDDNVNEWNVARLDTILDVVENDTGVKIEGVNTPYLYFGMWKSSFAWHTEDMDLYSINYVHFGAPKTWYSIPPEHGKRFERLASGFFPNSKSTCPAFLRHKMTLISPSVLRQYGIPPNKMTQEAGQFMVTFPYGYHSGFNHGFNCAESTNFASERWIDYGIASEKCNCRKDMVYINMDLLVKAFQPDKYERWKSKKLDLKLSYTDIPPVPKFDEEPLHWRKRVEIIRKMHEEAAQSEKPVTVPTKQQKTPTKSPTKVKRSRSVSSTSKKQSPVRPDVSPDHTFVKLAPMPCQEGTSEVVKKSLNELFSACSDKSKTSNSLVTEPTMGRFQLSLGSVLDPSLIGQSLSTSEGAEELSEAHCSTLFDRVKMKRRNANSVILDAKDASVIQEVQHSALLFNSDHNSYTKKSQSPLHYTKQFLKPSSCISDQEPSTSSSSPLYLSQLKWQNNTNRGLSLSSTSSSIISSSPFQSPSVPKKPKMSPLSKVGQTHATEADLKAEETAAARFLLMMKNGKASSEEAQTSISNIQTQPPKLKTLKSSRPQMKRRHPVSKRGPSKKSSPTPMLKNMSEDSSEEDSDVKIPQGLHARGVKLPFDKVGYANLWPRRKTSFKNERQYNSTVAKLEPHCAICTLFQPYYRKSLNSKEEPPPLATLLKETPRVPPGTKTKPLIPEINFATSINNPAPLATCAYLDKEGKSVITQCKECMVQVHASCYGVEKPPGPGETWTCDRCSFKAWTAQCALCCMRGGALKPVKDGLQWAHILCSIAIPEVSFDDIPRRTGINIMNLSPTRQKLKCTYCKRNKSRGLEALGTCIQCCAGVCAVSFHATCAHAAGVKMETGDWPLPVFVYCHRHALQKERSMQTKANKVRAEVTLGQTVYGKHRNGRYYPCTIRSESTQHLHHVLFVDDNSWSDNLQREDIISHDFKKSPPKAGDLVQVMWTDGKVYNARYQQCKKQQILTVEFEDSSVLTLKREEMYANMEEMPNRIKKKLSHATDMSKGDHLESPKKSCLDSYTSQKAAFNSEKKRQGPSQAVSKRLAERDGTASVANEK